MTSGEPVGSQFNKHEMTLLVGVRLDVAAVVLAGGLKLLLNNPDDVATPSMLELLTLMWLAMPGVILD